MVALDSFRHTGAPLEAELDIQTRLSPRSAMLCILALSLLCWGAVLLPLWAAV